MGGNTSDAKFVVIDASNPDMAMRYNGTSGGHKTRLMFMDKRGVINAQVANVLHNDGVGTAAADLEFASSTGGTLTANMMLTKEGNLKFNSGYGSLREAYGVRAWANYDHVAATIRGSAQLTSVTDTSTGRGTFNWAFTFVDQYYAAVGTSGGGGGDYGDDNAVTWAGSDHGTTTLSFRTDNFKTNANHDSDNLNVVIVR